MPCSGRDLLDATNDALFYVSPILTEGFQRPIDCSENALGNLRGIAEQRIPMDID